MNTLIIAVAPKEGTTHKKIKQELPLEHHNEFKAIEDYSDNFEAFGEETIHSTLFDTNCFKGILEECPKFHLKLKVQFLWPRGLF